MLESSSLFRVALTRRESLGILAAGLGVFASALGTNVHAQSRRMEASVLASQARMSLRRGDVPDAVRLFRQSIALEPDARVVRELATVLEQQGNRREASRAWAQYATLALTQSERDMAITRSELLRRSSAILRVRVEPWAAAREARVWFDHDVPRPVPVGGAEAFVDGGEHRVRVESRGYQTFETMVTTAFGEAAEVVVTLRPLGDSSPGDAAVLQDASIE